ncbi:hypothetical protein HJC23_011744 [Cyclotella cryptica]|uniref:Uncharacterized protein n=1 Tax=Cyclotella cryptica TaxID=29204 RepID=A0ABD3PG04_9STRA|eukprot:CCRYP_014785-RA/>CCRYP_014785-RA protein AED:0.00 eAED:0.00 QI:0/0/0/1/1/1/2/0/957
MENTLLLSLYLLGPNDILHSNSNNDGADATTITQRATLYTRLSHACHLANEYSRHEWFRRASRGDGWVFGVHCLSEEEVDHHGRDDGDEWMTHLDEVVNDGKRRRSTNNHHSQQHQPHLRAMCHYTSTNEAWHILSFALQLSKHLSLHQLDCALLCIDASDGQLLLIEAAEVLPSWVDDDVSQGGVRGPAGCGERCWVVEGKIRLIPPESHGHAPGEECQRGEATVDDVTKLGRTEALCLLRDCINSDKYVVDEVQEAISARIERTDYSLPQRRKRKPISCKNDPYNMATTGDVKECTVSSKESHYHIAAVAVPATVAYFLSEHWYLIPFFVDSFCKQAPQYLNERHCHVAPNANADDCRDERDAMQPTVDASSTNDCQVTDSKSTTDCDPNSNQQRNNNSNKNYKHNEQSSNSSIPNNATKHPSTFNLGTHFPYERIVLVPVVMTRTTYAELITGRGIIPSFPIPTEYRSVELNRFQRQLQQMVGGCGDDDYFDTGRRKNVWTRAVEVGVRLCAGLEWALLNDHTVRSASNTFSATKNEEEERVFQSMGEVERRLRLYWCRIDAEATCCARRPKDGLESDSMNGKFSWIEQAWQAGPNNDISGDKTRNKLLIDALQSMSKCPVFHPELSKPPHEEPCPYSRPGISLHEMTHAGICRALKWVRDEYNDASFPLPREWEVDDDSWMEVNSLEELEDEMRKLSSATDQTRADSKVVGKSRRVTRRSRRNRIHDDQPENVDMADESTHTEVKSESADAKSLNKMIHGFKSLVEGEGDLGGVVTRRPAVLSSRDCVSPQQLMLEEVSINPRVFLNILHDKLHQNSDATIKNDNKESAITAEENISKFFFKEDLEDDSSDGSQDSNAGMECDELDDTSLEQDPESIRNIMQAMDHELRAANTMDPSLQNIGAQSNDDDINSADYNMVSNFLKSLEAEGAQSGPVTNMLREMGICPPRLSSQD